MGFNYYQNAGSGWGTNQFQFGAPPEPDFQPQPGWGGLDYFNAHAVSSDPSLYNHAFSRVREHAGSGRGFGIGVGMHEAKQWHRRAYGGVGEVNHMLPEQIGHAAAYEAYRTWVHNSSMYEPLSDDLERQTEGLIGFAVAEATRLLHDSGRSWDKYARMTAGEAAAATASYISTQSSGMDMDFGDSHRMGRSRSRHNSFSGYGPSSYSDSSMYNDYGGGIDPYAYDDGYGFGAHGRHGRSRSRHRSRHRAHSMSDPMMMGQPGYGHTGSFGGGYAGSGPGFATSFPVAGSSYSSHGGGFPGSYPISSSIPVGGSVYGGYGGVPVSGGSQVIVATKPHRSSSRHRSKHRSSSRHRHHRSRSRSRGAVIVGGGGGGYGGYGGYGGGYTGSYY